MYNGHCKWNSKSHQQWKLKLCKFPIQFSWASYKCASKEKMLGFTQMEHCSVKNGNVSLDVFIILFGNKTTLNCFYSYCSSISSKYLPVETKGLSPLCWMFSITKIHSGGNFSLLWIKVSGVNFLCILLTQWCTVRKPTLQTEQAAPE